MGSANHHKEDSFDVCIVGAGPAGLTCLSAIAEPFAVDTLREHEISRALRHMERHHDKLRVCVLDPAGSWMASWKRNFAKLRIQHLRSPALAHPDMFDPHALLAYASRYNDNDNNKNSNNDDKSSLLESGCWDRKDLLALGQTQVGLWKLPSTRMFADFCHQLATTLPHTFLAGKVLDVDDVPGGMYQVTWCDNASSVVRYCYARHVVLATGMAGRPVVPPGLANCPRMHMWNEPGAFAQARRINTLNNNKKQQQRVLVVGGGLTAVQVALRVVQDQHECVLCSRAPLREKHFDIPVEWFDLRKSNVHLSDIYHNDMADRLCQLKEARNGGSVPSMYLKRLAQYKDNLVCCTGHVEFLEETVDGVWVAVNGVRQRFDKIILACGVQPDAAAHAVMGKLLLKWPIEMHGGYPALTQDLQWHASRPNLFVVGAMSALQVGPDAGNLMGMRRAAKTVSSALQCRGWLREQVLANPFDALWASDSDDDDDDDDDSSSSESDDDMESNDSKESDNDVAVVTDSSSDCMPCAGEFQDDSDTETDASQEDCSTCASEAHDSPGI